MIAQKAKKKSGYVLDDGVGVKWDTNKHGWGLEQAPHIAVLIHPIHGMSVWGPFVSEDAAHAWVRRDGDGAAMHYFGTPGESRWHVTMIHVPTHPRGE